MHKLSILILFASILFFYQTSKAQCPFQYVSVADSGCPLQSPTVVGNLPNNFQTTWDFCPGDLATAPQISNAGGFIFGQLSFKALKENGKYYLWYPVGGSSSLFRVEFGNSLTNTPSYVASNPSNLANTNSWGFDMIKDTGNSYIAFLTDLNSDKFFKVEFDSINDDTLIFKDLNIAGVSGSRCVKAIDHSVFVTNYATQYIIRIDFNADFSDTLSVTQLPIPFSYAQGLDVVYDCTYNEYFVFAVQSLTGELWYSEMGSDVKNNNLNWLLKANGIGDARGIQLIKDFDSWYFFTNNSNNRVIEAKMSDLKMDTIHIVLDTISTLVSIPFGISTIIDSSCFHVFVSCYNNGSIAKFDFQSNCNFNNAWQEGNTPSGFSYPVGTTGWQNFQVSTTLNNGYITTNLDSIYISIPPPVANFVASNTCEGNSSHFNDLSAICYGSITGWFWDFGDNIGTSTFQNPDYVYSTSGNYNVTLTVYSSNGDSSVLLQIIDVSPKPTADFNAVTSACANTGVQFSDASLAPQDSITIWNWFFGNGDSSNLQNPTYSYNAVGVYSIQLYSYNSKGCVDSTFKNIQINPSPAASFSFTNTCTNDSVFFSNLTDSVGINSVNYLWYFGDADSTVNSNPSHIFSNGAGTYDVTMIASGANGCIDTTASSVVVSNRANPDFDFTPQLACINNTIIFTTQSTTLPGDSIILSTWDFGDSTLTETGNTFTHTYSSSGSYYVTLTVKTPSSCDTSVIKNVVVIPSPEADFTFTNACYASSNIFSNNSIPVTGDSLVSFLWNFGDSQIDNGIVVPHLYDSAGIYNVTLEVISSLGCIDTISKTVEVYHKPNAAFNNSSLVCNKDTTFFTDLSTAQNSSVINWNWNFGDGANSFLQNPYHIFSPVAIDTVSLIVQSLQGCSDTSIKILNVLPNIQVDFNFQNQCKDDQTQFAFINLDTALTASAWNWFFDDGGYSYLQNPLHKYNANGSYQVTLTTTGSNGCKTYLEKSIEIFPKPVSNFITNNACSNQLTTLTDSSYISSGSITNWLWITGNDTSITSSISFTSAQSGYVPVLLITSSDKGCKDSLNSLVQINETPVAQFNYSPAYVIPGEALNLTSSGSVVPFYDWNFGDTNVGTGASITHAYSDTGYYHIQLIATSVEGCSDSISQLFHVLFPVPDIAITNTSASVANNLISVKATVINLSNFDVTHFQIKTEIENVPTIFEFPNMNLPVGSGPKDYLFQSKVYASNNQMPDYYCVEVDKPNGLTDANFSNNRLCRNSNSSFEILNVTSMPIENNLTVNYSLPFSDYVSLSIYDSDGKLVLKKDIGKKLKGYNTLTLDITQLASGIYALTMTTSNETANIKISKK